MAEVTAMRNNALPYEVYGVPWTLILPIYDADGDLVTGAAGLDSEVSKNGDTPADCTNEATEIGSSGKYYLSLTGTEMTADIVDGVTKTSTSGAKTTPWTLYPKKLPALRSGTSQAGAAGTITLDSGASALDDAYNGCLIVATLDSAVEARIITDYVGSTKVASVTPNWNTTPDSDDTFIIYLPDGVQVNQANVTAFGGVAGTFASGIPETKVASIAAGAITAGAIAANAINAAKLDPDVTTELQAGLATASALATAQTSIDDLPTNAELATALAAADDAVLAAIAALNNLSAAQVTAAVPTANANADALLKRDWTAVTGEAARSMLNAMRFARNRFAIAGGTLTVYKEDDSTPAWTGAVTQTAGDPISQIDPA